MARIATVAFIFSIIGATYQLVSYSILGLAEPRSAFYYSVGFGSPFFLSIAVFSLASHLVDDHRIIWPTMIFAIAVSSLINLFITYLNPTGYYAALLVYQTVSPTGLLILVPAPLLILAGAILGFAASTLHLRQHGQTVMPSTTTQSKLN